MKRALAILRWLGVKRVIASAVLGVVFPLLFAAWVASSPTSVLLNLSNGRAQLYMPREEQDAAYLMYGTRSRAQTRVLTMLGSDDELNSLAAIVTEFSPDAPWVQLPHWATAGTRNRGNEQEFEDIDMSMMQEVASGWPLRCIVFRDVHYRGAQLAWQTPIDVVPALRVPRGWWTEYLLGPRPIPLAVIPTGLALNWLFYAPLFYLLLSAMPCVRHVRRIRRGLCTRCGYDLAGLASCPECGKDRS